ncbi:formimidoylglutamase [Bdellovibrio svalbardensis]|uniref:Formimidoylglutamase n=1 Tax=Bdellovibrio svalbardensis TaxID=2972972 RepID=A0ABT6DSV7_9BACT|nr:formimidoylglutamase [Bdellovibrio svalbardensis]MDG0818238.1 formimidoylglutamase [Bdellovibrio svalbardensis]
MSWLHPIDKHLLFTKNDKEDPRLGECVQLLAQGDLDPSNKQFADIDFAILGYPDDEGIALNGGRVGAQVAPKEIRTYLYKMTPHLESTRLPKILDLGDLDKENPLAERHEKGRELIRHLAKNNKHWVSFGGGHDYGYCDSTGFLDAHPHDAVVINFDAHMDVRPTDKGFNSGTPFHRLLTEFSDKVDFAEVGIQNQCNSRYHIEWAKKHRASVFTLDQVNEQGLQSLLQNYLKGKEKKKIFLSVDIDAFTSNEAPGCSQSWTTGLFTKEFLNSLHWLIQNFNVRGLGIYEVSPPLDQDKRTCKLAALLAHNFIFATLNKA